MVMDSSRAILVLYSVFYEVSYTYSSQEATRERVDLASISNRYFIFIFALRTFTGGRSTTFNLKEFSHV